MDFVIKGLVTSFLLLSGCYSAQSAPVNGDKDLVFLCQSGQYQVEIYQSSDDYLMAHFTSEDGRQVVEGLMKRVGLFDSENESTGTQSARFYYTYNSRAQYESYDIEFGLGEEVRVDAYRFYDGQFDSNESVGFWLHKGQEQKNYSCADGYVDRLHRLNKF